MHVSNFFKNIKFKKKLKINCNLSQKCPKSYIIIQVHRIYIVFISLMVWCRVKFGMTSIYKTKLNNYQYGNALFLYFLTKTGWLKQHNCTFHTISRLQLIEYFYINYIFVFIFISCRTWNAPSSVIHSPRNMWTL